MLSAPYLRMVGGIVSCLALAAHAGPTTRLRGDYQRNSLSLAGTWQVVTAASDARLFDPATGAKQGGWRDTALPGGLLSGLVGPDEAKIDTVWARRTFTLSAPLPEGAVLRFFGIRYGVTAWINGTEIGSHPTTGPGAILIPAGLLREGENQIVLRVPGWAGLPRSKSGFPLIPTGAGTQTWGRKSTAIEEDIGLEFYQQAHIASVIAMADPAQRKVTFRARFDSTGVLPALQVSALVRDAAGQEVARSSVARPATTNPVDVVVSMPAATQLWTPQTPYLYTAQVTAALPDGGTCDQLTFRFGMRDVRIEKGHYLLNGQPLWLRGSNLVTEWEWGHGWLTDTKRFLVDEARAMNLNCFRTHTRPLPADWADVADENGIMILAELPVLFNNENFKFTPEEQDTWHRNCLIDAKGWIAARANHPSVIMWVLSNESRYDDAWEAGAFRDAVLALDPTRPTMRTGDRVPDNRDMHTCGNFTEPPEGKAIREFTTAANGRDADRTLTNSEYMNIFGTRQELAAMWLGQPDADYAPAFAECAAEHTEAMRRLRFDGILPYMYSPWTRMRGNAWRADFPTPIAAALHSAMAPVLASVELFDRNFVAGRKMTTPLHLINETHEDVEVRVDVYLTARDPLFIPEQAALDAAIFRDSFRRTLKADSVAVEDLKWSVPTKPGTYYLAVVTTRTGSAPVVSQRIVRALEPVDQAMRGRELIVLGDEDGEIGKCFKAAGASVATSILTPIQADAIVICDSGKVADVELALAPPAVQQYVKGGGRLLILNQSRWAWSELLDLKIDSKAGKASRAFLSAGAAHPMLDSIAPDALQRWNALPGTVADAALRGPAMANARPLLWAVKPDRIIAASIPMGDGEVLVNLLQFRGRLDREAAGYDPAAERMLVHALDRGPTTRP